MTAIEALGMTMTRRTTASDAVQPRMETILQVSYIPVRCTGGTFESMDLWARDINAQAAALKVMLLCPIVGDISGAVASLSSAIEVFDIAGIGDPELLPRLLQRADFVQLPGNHGWQGSKAARAVLRQARRHGNASVFLGISSNRARTSVINSRHAGVLRRLRSYLRYADIRLTQRYLARLSDGVVLAGAGLLPLVARDNANIHIGTASWISETDIVDQPRRAAGALRVCMAGRLERMKGFHLGIEAIAGLDDREDVATVIIGQGPEEQALRALLQQHGIANVPILAPVPYPKPFFDFLDQQDVVLLTNLNDEQPRLIFDAISRGCVPLCPDSPAYRALGLDGRALYRRGDVADMRARLIELKDPARRSAIMQGLRAIAKACTVEAMHQERLRWMQVAKADAA